jgi:branched-chain amino acid transport system ATP-binding protein
MAQTTYPPRRVLFTFRGVPCHKPRGLRRYFNEVSAGESPFPLIVLIGFVLASELDVTAFFVLGPDIKDSFHLSNGGYLAIIALTTAGGLLLTVPLAYYSDRLRRVMIAVAGAAIWAVFGFFTAFCFTLVALVIVRAGAGIGRAVVTPTHNSLLADYYPPETRTQVFGGHQIGLHTGAAIGGILGGALGYYFGWRLPFALFVIPSIVFVLMGMRLREPGRGHFERAAAGADEDVVGTDEVPPSFAESIRILWAIGTLRRIFYALPFLAAAFIGLVALTSLYYQQVFHMGDFSRGFIVAIAEPGQVVAILLGIPLAARLMMRDPGAALRMLAFVAIGVAACWTVFCFAPWVWLAITMHCLTAAFLALLTPGIYATLSLAIPPKARAMGYSFAALFILPGLLSLYVIGGIADTYGIRIGLFIATPLFLIGSWVLASGSIYVKSDINRVWTSTAAQAEVALKRKQGEVKLLLVRNVDVHYDGVQVLFGVNFEVDAGEVVALLGTNGAGKSTLIKTISGLVQATNGAVVFDGRDMTYAPPNEVAERGVVMMPGGQGVFPSISVADHLRLAGWIHRKNPDHVKATTDRVFELFPILAERMSEPAGNLSGGQQQMLAMGMAFIEGPRLLMIDELSLGLAPAIVEQLLPLVRELAANGTTIVLVEQSVNLALTVADTAYFMEKGEIRFHGPTKELLERPDVLRSVFLEGAATLMEAEEPTTVRATTELIETPHKNGHSNNPPRLSLDGVWKNFGGLAALTDVSFTASAGEIVGFIGPNGAGKTTLFDVISGFLDADRGKIVFGDGEHARDITRLSAATRARLGLGRSFQDGRLFGSLTVRETIALAYERHLDVRDPVAAALRLPYVVDAEDEVDAGVENLLELLGITDFREKLIRELSTGSRRIVDLACVIAHGPSVLLLDEPSSGIAQREAEALGPVLLRVRERTGATVLVIEHDVPLLLGIADRVIALDLGEVVGDGDPDEVVHDERVVTSYLGAAGTAVARSGQASES